MTSTKKQIISGILSSGRANINNINNNNNDNNNNYFKVIAEDENSEEMTDLPAAASGLASLPASQNSGKSFVSGVGRPLMKENLPKAWRGVKLDLFDNINKKTGEQEYKLKLTIQTEKGGSQPILANLGNSRDRDVFKKVTPEERQEDHWIKVKSIIQMFKSNKIEFRASKCVLPQKKGTTTKVVFLVQCDEDQCWQVILVDRGETYEFLLPFDFEKSENQKNTTIVSSLYVGKTLSQWVDEDALGI